jgi:formylglycine-generating enzyme required for sulfatase activity
MNDWRAAGTAILFVVFLMVAIGCSQPVDPSCQPICSDGACGPGSWVALCPGTYTMGPVIGDLELSGEARREVTLTHPFEVLTTEVTQQMFEELLGFNPSTFAEGTECDWCQPCGPDCPADTVGRSQAAAWCNALSEQEGLDTCYRCEGEGAAVTCERDDRFETPYDCPGYRLPTDAEWEYAARAGTRTSNYNGDIDWYDEECPRYDSTINEIAWFCGNADILVLDEDSGWEVEYPSTHPVAQKMPNDWGLYDVHGNVDEWCEDGYCHWRLADRYGCETNIPPSTEPATDPWSPPSGTGGFILRGGGIRSDIVDMRAAVRGAEQADDPGYSQGFRPVRTLESVVEE